MFKHRFQDMLNTLCDCGMGVESSTNILLQCLLFLNKKCTLMSNLNKIDPQISKMDLSNLINTLLFGKVYPGSKVNILIVYLYNILINYTRLQPHSKNH